MTKKTLDHRSFLRLSATAGAGTLFSSTTFESSISGSIHTLNKSNTIPVRTLGKAGVELPI